MVDELFSANGLLLRRDAIAAGYDDNGLARLVRAGTIERVRQGAYARTGVWNGLDEVGRHSLRCDAVLAQYDDRIALSHDSAVLRHRGPNHRLDLTAVNVTHLYGTGDRNVAGVQHHVGRCGVLDITRIDDHWTTSPARTVLDIAMKYGLEVGVVVADDFLRRELTTPEELWLLHEQLATWPGALILRLVIRLADPRSESVGETIGRLLFRRLGLPAPQLQFEVFHPNGSLAGRSDWAWPDHKTLGEFDGKSKYLRHRREGESVTDAVLREKRREDLLRELTGWRFIRLVWADLYQAQRTAERLLAVLHRAAA